MRDRAKRVIWAYDREHLLHPFIVMGVNTLIDAGFDVTVVSADRAENARYHSTDDFSFAVRVRKFQHLVFGVRGRLEQKAVDDHLACRKLQRQLDERGRKALRGWRRVKAKARMAAMQLEATLIMPWREVLKAYGNWRRLNPDTWKIYLRGFAGLMRTEGEVMIASRPEAAAWACLVAKLRGMRFIYFPFELYGEQIVRPNPLVAAIERFILRHCVDAVVTQNDCRAQVLVEERGSRVVPLIVHNYKPAQPLRRTPGRLRARHGIGRDKNIILYEGVIVDGRWLEYVAQSILHLPDDTVLVMMGQEKMKWRATFADQIAAAMATGRVYIAPPVPHDELLDYVADADVGIIIYDDSVRNNVFCEPGKLTDYISVGVPVVAPNFPTIGPVVREFGIGLCFDGHSPEIIASTIRAVLAKPRRQWAPNLKRACSELTWETQAPNLLAAVTGAAAQSGAALQLRRGDASPTRSRPKMSSARAK